MRIMEENDYINQIENLTVDQIVEGVTNGIVTFNTLRQTGDFDFTKQKAVKAKLREGDDKAYDEANYASTKIALEHYLSVFPKGIHVDEVKAKLQKILKDEGVEKLRIVQVEDILKEIKEDINKNTLDEVKAKLSTEDFKDLCDYLSIDYSAVTSLVEPTLKFNAIPKSKSEVPEGYTDVFFWGIPSSGKTCALSSIFSTIHKEYKMEAPDCETQFGSKYRKSLVKVFNNNNDYGYLPARTNIDRTQYMPFQLSKKNERRKRRVSFFELSGELFKHFDKVVNGEELDENAEREQEEEIKKTFKALELLLKSDNKKIHYFFIDYKTAINQTSGTSQEDYLEAATIYFRDNEIFKKKTDAVNVVITKSDEIKGSDKERVQIAIKFLNDNFSNFMSVLKDQCKDNSVEFNVKLFSIGDVYFKRICKINRTYSRSIIDDLLRRIKPVSNNIFIKFFNS